MAAPFSFLVVGTTTASALTSSPTPLDYGVTLKADAANSGKVHIGFSGSITTGTASSAGFQLSAGEGYYITKNACKGDAANIFLIASATTQNLFAIGE